MDGERSGDIGHNVVSLADYDIVAKNLLLH
jgi:hypothetical protein